MTRIQKFQKYLTECDLSACIIDNPLDLYYLLGHKFSLGRLVVAKEEATLYVDGRYYEQAKKNLPLKVVLTASYGPENPFFKDWKFKGEKIGFDAESTPYAVFEELSQLPSQFVPLKNPLKPLREIKEEGEQRALREAALLGSQGFDCVCSHLKQGVTERELVKELEIFWLKLGGEGVAFPPHIAFGENTAYPHYQPGDKKLKHGECVLIDIGVIKNRYYSDMTRVVAFGLPPDPLKTLYATVFEAQKTALAMAKPGEKIEDLDHAARSVIERAGYGEYFTHGLGHGVGLEIHEAPRVRSIGPDAGRRLQKGMVITIEPGIYIPGLGGVRLEDTVLITNHGHENLTCRPLSKDLPVL